MERFNNDGRVLLRGNEKGSNGPADEAGRLGLASSEAAVQDPHEFILNLEFITRSGPVHCCPTLPSQRSRISFPPQIDEKRKLISFLIIFSMQHDDHIHYVSQFGIPREHVSVSKINLHVVCCIYRGLCRLTRLSFRRAWRRADLRPAQETLMSPGTPQHGIHVKVVHRDIRSILFIHFSFGRSRAFSTFRWIGYFSGQCG
jgi:hypothetical protein